MKKQRFYKMYLDDLLSAIIKIESYIQGFDFENFMNDNKSIDAVIRNLEVIGEAANKLPDDFKDKHKEVPWKEMYLLRNKISHEYFGIDYEIIWDIITNYLPENKKQIEMIINEEGENSW